MSSSLGVAGEVEFLVILSVAVAVLGTALASPGGTQSGTSRTPSCGAGMNCDPQILQAPPHARATARKPNTIMLWSEALASATRFYANKLRYVYFEPLSQSEEDIETGAVRHVRATAAGVSAICLTGLGLDGLGLLSAVQPAWIYLSDFAAAGAGKTTLSASFWPSFRRRVVSFFFPLRSS